MVTQLLAGYLIGWAIAAVGVYVAGKRLSDNRSPVDHRLGVSVAAAALWPLLLVGVVEFSSLAVYAKTRSKSEPDVGVLV